MGCFDAKRKKLCFFLLASKQYDVREAGSSSVGSEATRVERWCSEGLFLIPSSIIPHPSSMPEGHIHHPFPQ